MRRKKKKPWKAILGRPLIFWDNVPEAKRLKPLILWDLDCIYPGVWLMPHNPSTPEVNTWGLWLPGRPGIHSKTLSEIYERLKNYVEDMTQWQNPCLHKVLLQFPTLGKKTIKQNKKHVWGSEAKSTFGAVRWFSEEGACLSQDRPFWKRGAQWESVPVPDWPMGKRFLDGLM